MTDLLREIKKYNKTDQAKITQVCEPNQPAPNIYSEQVFKLIKANLTGLPGFCRLVIFELLSYCDYQTGIISISTLEEVAHNDFYVQPSPGRKKEIINSDTLRNAFRTIKKFKPGLFLFKTENQRIVIEMPFLRDLYQQHLNEISQVAAVDDEVRNALITYTSTDESPDLNTLFTEEDVPDVAAASLRSIKDINNLTKNITNKPEEGESKFLKKLVPLDFYPCSETIQLAKAEGYTKVTDTTEIKKFIKYNTDNNCRWEDFNPIYLAWLKKDKEFSPSVIKPQSDSTSKNSRSRDNERSSHKNNSYERAMEQVLRDNPDALAPSEDLFVLKPCDFAEFVDTTYQLGLAQTNRDLWTVVR